VDHTTETKGIKQETRLAKFYIVSGCSDHVVKDSPHYTMGKINGCTKNSGAKILGYGSIEQLGNVLYAPQVTANLISVSQLTDNGFEVEMLGDSGMATRSGKRKYIVIEGVKSANG